MKVMFSRVKIGATIIYKNQSYWVLHNRTCRSLAFQPEVEIVGRPFDPNGLWRTWDSVGSPTRIPPDAVVEVVEMTYRPITEKEAKDRIS